jgi:hypothetical protein
LGLLYLLLGWPLRVPAFDLDPQPVGSWRQPSPGFARDVAVAGNYAYVAAQSAGLQVIDVSNPADPQRVGGYATGVYAEDVAVSGNFAYVAAGFGGLEVIDVSDPANPQRVGGNSAFRASAVVVNGDKVYIAADSDGLIILNTLNTYQSRPRLAPFFRLDPSGFHLLLRAAPGQGVRLQRTADLKTWADWQVVSGTGSYQPLVDESAGADSARFYRAVIP